MHSTHVIKRPLLSEKSTFGMNEQNRYSFEVDPRATKVDIRKAVEELYKVSVVKVNTSVRVSGQRRVKFGVMGGDKTKKATVSIKEGQKIELF